MKFNIKNYVESEIMGATPVYEIDLTDRLTPKKSGWLFVNDRLGDIMVPLCMTHNTLNEIRAGVEDCIKAQLSDGNDNSQDSDLTAYVFRHGNSVGILVSPGKITDIS